MSEFMFGVTKNKPTRREAAKIATIARRHKATFVEVNVREDAAPGINNGRYQAWFAGPNYGSPFDQRMASAVEADIDAAGIVLG